MIRLVFSAMLALLATGCSPVVEQEGEAQVVFQFEYDDGKNEFELGPRSRQWFIETIEGVPLIKYDPQAAREEPSGFFKMGERKFYLFGMGVWEINNPERFLRASSYIDQLHKNLKELKIPVKNPKEIKEALDKLEQSTSFEFIPNKVQVIEPEKYPAQELIDRFKEKEGEEAEGRGNQND